MDVNKNKYSIFLNGLKTQINCMQILNSNDKKGVPINSKRLL